MEIRSRLAVALVLAAVVVPSVPARAEVVGDWTLGFGGGGFDGSVVAEPLDDGSVIAVAKHGFGADGAVSIRRVGTDGAVLWTTTVPEDAAGGFYGTEFASSLELASGEVLFSGYSDHSGTTGGKFDALVLGVSPDGTWRTVASWGGPGAEFARDMAECDDGSVFVGGTVWDGEVSPGETEAVGMIDIFVTRFDPQLRRTWTRQIGSRNNDALFSLGCRGDGSVDLNAWAAGAVNGMGDDAYYNFVHVRLSSAGGTVRTVARQQDAGEWSPQDGVHAADGSYYVVGESNGGYFRAQCTEWALGGSFVAKFSPDGEVLWWDLLPCANLNRKIVVGASGDLFVLGEANGKRIDGQQKFGGTDFLLHRYSPNGRRLWTRQFGSPSDEVGSSLAVDGNGGVILGAYTKGVYGGHEPVGDWDALVIRTDVGDVSYDPVPAPAAACDSASATVLPESPTAQPIWIYGDDIGEVRMAALWQYAQTHGPHDFGRLIGAGQNWFETCRYPGIGLGTGSGYDWHDRNVVLWVWADGVDLDVARASVLAMVDSLVPVSEPAPAPAVSATVNTAPQEQAPVPAAVAQHAQLQSPASPSSPVPSPVVQSPVLPAAPVQSVAEQTSAPARPLVPITQTAPRGGTSARTHRVVSPSKRAVAPHRKDRPKAKSRVRTVASRITAQR